MDKFALENDADLSIAVLWACATSPDNKFAMGTIDSPYNSYYFAARAAAFVAVSKWLMHLLGITHGYSPAATNNEYVITLAEEILATMADCGPEPVRQLKIMAEDKIRDIAEIEVLLRPEF